MARNNNRSESGSSQNFEEFNKDQRLNDILNRDRSSPRNLLLRNHFDEDNYKDVISRTYQNSNDLSNQFKKRAFASESSHQENKSEDLQEKDVTKNEIYLDPQEEKKIEEHIRQFKANSVQQYSIMLHYFKLWREINSGMKELEKVKKRDTYKSPVINLKPSMENDFIDFKNKKLQRDFAASPSKNMKIGLENQNFESKVMKEENTKKKARAQKTTKEGEVIIKISKKDILKFIPFCNDVVLPKKTFK